MASGAGVFKQFQPEYAARGITTFPCKADKVPAIRNYERVGKVASGKLAARSSADAFGFMLGQRSRLSVVDIDTTDERAVADAENRFGKTPLIIRSGSGHHQLWYRNNGEGRHIRPFANDPIDILGRGYVVAPPSKTAKGGYRIIQGSLDDLDRLPTIQPGANVSANKSETLANVSAREGRRNTELFRHLMRQVKWCDDFAALLDVAHGFNDNCEPPLADDEVVRTAQSAWGYEARGQNRFGQTGAFISTVQANLLIGSAPDAALLLMFLKANNGPWAKFMCANGLTERLGGMPRKRIAAARKRLIDLGYMRCVRPAASNAPALFRWNDQAQGQGSRVRGSVVEDRWSNSTTPTRSPVITKPDLTPAPRGRVGLFQTPEGAGK